MGRESRVGRRNIEKRTQIKRMMGESRIDRERFDKTLMSDKDEICSKINENKTKNV